MIRDRSRWPVPGDTPLDRARRVAHTYRAALRKLDQTQADAIDADMTAVGETWVTPQPALYRGTDWLTLEEAADYTGGTRDMIYKWATRKPVRLPSRKDERGRILVQLDAVIEAQRDLRIRRANRAS